MKTTRNNLKDIMTLAWSFVKRNGFTMAEAMKTAWRNYKLKNAMHGGIVQFFFMKVDGTLRQAFGTLDPHRLPETQGKGRKANETVQVYFDTDKQEYRSFKKCNLVKMM